MLVGGERSRWRGRFVTDRTVRRDVQPCSEEGCEETAAFELHIPWDANRVVCAGHARVLASNDGVVADALPSAQDELP